MNRLTATTASLILASILATATLAAQPQPGDLLGSTGSIGGSLVDLDPATGQGAFLADLGSLGPVTEIVFREDGVLFGSTGGGSSHIITIDPATGIETLVGQHDLGAVNGMVFVDGELYGTFFQPPGGASEGDGGPGLSLVTIDQQTGQTTEIGPIDAFLMRGLAYDVASDSLFGVGVAPNERETFFEIDRATGTATPIAELGTAIGGIRFGPDGILYGGEAIGGGGESATEGITAALLSIDLASGATSVIGDTGQAALSGLAFVPPNAAAVIEVPTLSGVGLMAISVLLLAAAMVAIRRRATV